MWYLASPDFFLGNPRFFHPPIFKGKSFIFRQSPYESSDVSLIWGAPMKIMVSWHLTRGCSWCSAKQAASTSRNLKPGTGPGDPGDPTKWPTFSGNMMTAMTNWQHFWCSQHFWSTWHSWNLCFVILSVPISRKQKQIYHKSITQKNFPAAAASLQKQLGPHPPCASSCQPGHQFLALNMGIVGTFWVSRYWKVPKVTRSYKCLSYSGW